MAMRILFFLLGKGIEWQEGGNGGQYFLLAGTEEGTYGD